MVVRTFICRQLCAASAARSSGRVQCQAAPATRPAQSALSRCVLSRRVMGASLAAGLLAMVQPSCAQEAQPTASEQPKASSTSSSLQTGGTDQSGKDASMVLRGAPQPAGRDPKEAITAAERQIEGSGQPPAEAPSAKRIPTEGSAESSRGPEVATGDSAKRLLDDEEERRKQRRRKKGRIRELEEIRAELAEKELRLLSKEQELFEKEQTLLVLREELEIEKKLRTLLTKEKEKAEEEAALAMELAAIQKNLWHDSKKNFALHPDPVHSKSPYHMDLGS